MGSNQMRCIRVGEHYLIECGHCGPVAVLSDPSGALIGFAAIRHVSDHMNEPVTKE